MQSQQNIPKEPLWTILSVLEWTTSYFKSKDIDSSRATAEILLAHVLKKRRLDLYLNYDQPLSKDERNAFKELIKRRVQREPSSYILGNKEFFSMSFFVTRDVLIPRPDTECLVESVLSGLSKDKPLKVLDIGTGSGAIILALAKNSPEHIFFASDISMNAIMVAYKNALYHGIERSVYFFVGDFFAPLNIKGNLFDIIVSNPPYIPTKTIDTLDKEVSEYEPRIALDGGDDGLRYIKNIIDNAALFLNPGGELFMEIGYDQKDSVKKLIDYNSNYDNALFIKDYSGYNRVLRIRKGGLL
ncbi:MAG: peptide chain release factor N(5)-glutamine methyltransferase [Desulfobacterales bacterium]|nr:peptide chain release factor N(5)-glutamine methyltransferase [Desulfobacterales bacterium]